MVGAMVVMVVILVGWVGFRSLTTQEPDNPVQTVDYAQVVGPAKKAAPFDLVAPPTLPAGWRATSVGFSDQSQPRWHLGVLTDQKRYVGLEHAERPVRQMVAQYVDKDASRGTPVRVAGSAWSTYTDAGGDLALVSEDGRTTTLVVGHDVPRAQLLAYTASLR
jgi:hypothetical protein